MSLRLLFHALIWGQYYLVSIILILLFFLNLGSILSSLNHTYITFFPKVKSAVSVIKFRPITICKILYKLIFEVLANRLKRMLPQIISESQSAFQANKSIFANISVDFETLKSLLNRVLQPIN